MLEQLLSKEVADVSAQLPQSMEEMRKALEEQSKQLEDKDKVIEDKDRRIEQLTREKTLQSQRIKELEALLASKQ